METLGPRNSAVNDIFAMFFFYSRRKKCKQHKNTGHFMEILLICTRYLCFNLYLTRNKKREVLAVVALFASIYNGIISSHWKSVEKKKQNERTKINSWATNRKQCHIGSKRSNRQPTRSIVYSFTWFAISNLNS